METSLTKQNDQEQKSLIMVVDDNPEFLSGIELTLEMEGFEVWSAANGQQALDELQATLKSQAGRPREWLPDLIVADIMMPVMDGYTFYEQVQANPYMNHIPFIFLTAKSSDEDVRHGKELGVDDYLVKPFSPEDLLASIRGKLKRIERKRSLLARFTDDSITPSKIGFIIAIAIMGTLLIAAFCAGYLFSG